MAARERRGESTGVMGSFGAMKTVMGRMTTEMKRERVRLSRIYGNVYDKKAGDEQSVEGLAALADSGGADMPIARPGDAVIAAPFTSRAPSVRAVVSLIRQGRCTMLSALQQQQIMMLE